ncbi:BatD family protein [Pyxidicoccus xibeiensis]|uniref:BatD family protein n=1 Tax=Pyxidicoccus xibeiensis TaxID=2906759 RepID=UPI0020A76E9B|nr:BatD family protein [Pyxidicoccus xibeiensis]MCP3144134.1 BatD family protein [Pyxidicoccus xibeiensis]
MTRLLPWVLVLWVAAAPAWSAQPPGAPADETVQPRDVSVRVEPKQVRIGDPFTYEVVITHPKDHRYELALPKETGDFEVLNQTRQRQDGPDSATTTFGVRMSAFALGTQQVPALAFDVATPDGMRKFSLPGREVEVASTLPADADGQGAELFDYQPPQEVLVRSWRLVLTLLGALAAALLAWALWRWWKNRPKHVAVEPLLPLDVRTRKALDALKAQELPAKGHVKDFYFRLSEIIRGYLGERYGFEALECTSSELMASLRRLQAPGLPEDALMRFVSESDMVKYARADASPESCRDSLAFGYALIDQTYVPPPPPQAPVNAAAPRVQ